jgi:hypothetical protein
MGRHFHLVLNLDSFNAIITSLKNLGSGVVPTYPVDNLWVEWGRQLDRSATAGRDQSPELNLAVWYKE